MIPSEEKNIYTKKEIKTFSKKSLKLCSSCQGELPEKLDKGICPHCGVRN